MKADVTLSQIWFNQSLLSFFFRDQARETLDKIISVAGGKNNPDAFEELEEAVESYYEDLDEFEEDLYNEQTDDILANLGIEY